MRPLSSASRNINKLTSRWFDKQPFTQLMWRKLSKAGRGKGGRIVVWTKSSIKRRLRYPKINYSFRHWYVGFISTFRFIPFQQKLVALTFFGSGAAVYLQATDKWKIFQLMYPRQYRRPAAKWAVPSFFVLHQTRRLSRVSLAELSPGLGIQYIRSAGCFARFIKINAETHTAVLQLPSGVRKSFSLFSLASLGAVALRPKRWTANTKSGHWRSYGVKPHVRGVARNPIDHPHGGRTKSIKYPRTPWGKTTKFK